MSKIDALHEAAQKVTPRPPGPWTVDEWESDESSDALYGVGFAIVDADESEIATITRNVGDWKEHRALARYIALADPQTVMALIEEHRAAEPLRSPQGADESMRHYITRLFKTLTPSGINRLRTAIEKVERL